MDVDGWHESRGLSTVRVTVVTAVGLAVVVAAVIFMVMDRGESNDDEVTPTTGSPDANSSIEAMELQAQLVVVDDEVWVYGGLSGPAGSSPPVSSQLTDGWELNDNIVMYGVDGSLRFHAVVPGLNGREIRAASVIADGPERYLLASICETPRCRNGMVGELYRLDNNRAIPLPLRLPRLPDRDPDQTGLLNVIGRGDDGLVWATQTTAGLSEGLDHVRLLAIEITTGEVSEISLPPGLATSSRICMSGASVFGIQTASDESTLFIDELRVLRRSAMTDHAEWSLFFEPSLDFGDVWDTTLYCLSSGEILLLVEELNTSQSLAVTASPDDRGLVGEFVRVPSLGQPTPLGVIEDSDLFYGWVPLASGIQLFAHGPGGAWTEFGDPILGPVLPVVLDGKVRDARAAVARIDPDGVDLPVIDVSE